MYLTLSCCHLACPASLWHSGEACLTLGQWGTPLCAPRLLARVSMTGLTALYFIYLSLINDLPVAKLLGSNIRNCLECLVRTDF